jgi:hypothetical protein
MVAWFLVEVDNIKEKVVFVTQGTRTSGCAVWRSRVTSDLVARRRQQLQVNIGCCSSGLIYAVLSEADWQSWMICFFGLTSLAGGTLVCGCGTLRYGTTRLAEYTTS